MKNHNGLFPRKSMITKLLAILLLGVFYFQNSQAQVKIGKNPDQIGTASLLELESETKGLLLPRLPDTVAINALNPADGMLVYLDKTPDKGLYIRKNGIWSFLSGVSNVNNTIDESTLDLNKIGGKINPSTQLGADPSTISGQILKWNGTAWAPANESGSLGTVDATATTKGKLQLAGDLGGPGSTAAAPVISDAAISTSKILDLNVTDPKIASISGSKITGNISGNSANVTGIIDIANGGTGETTAIGVKTRLGLANVDNTTDTEKPISTATQTALNSKVSISALDLKAPIASPTFTGTVNGITSTMVGLGNVNNTTDANKPISTATQTALDLKASTTNLDLKAPLASPTFTGTVSGITSAMVGLGNVNNTTDLLKPISTAAQTALDLKASTANLDLKAPLASPTFTGTVSGITSAMVGLGNVDNTPDVNKPISTAAQTALDLKASTANLDLKAPIASPTFTGTVSGITSAMVGLGNANNTADADKPISTAAQSVLDLKADLASPALTGTPSAPTAAFGTNTTQLATTAFVLANADNSYSSVNAGTEISTTSTTDEVASGMTLTPGAGTYSVMFNGQYESSSAGVTGQGAAGLTAAYNQISGIAATNNHVLVFGSGETLGPGVYSVAGAGSVAGNLTLNAGGDANAVFIFKIDGAFTTGAGAVIILAGAAKASNVFWITTPSYAISMGATTTMKGTLIANNGAISMGAGGNLEGRLFSTTGAVGFGPGTASLPIGSSPIDFGGVANFVLFTSAGGVGNTGNSTITGNIGTNSGAITGFETSTVNGSFFTPVINGDALATFSIYQNGVLIANSSRTRTSTVNTVDVSLQAIAAVTADQAVDIRWNTSVGILKLKNRVLTLMRVQ